MNRPRSSRFLLAATLLAMVLAPASEVLADARTEARRHFRRGMELVVAGDVDGGVAELEEAYVILPHPNVLYNIGRAYAEAGRYDEARDYFERYLDSDPPDREEVRAVVAAIDQRLAARSAQAAATPATPTTPQAPTTIQVAGATPEQIAELRETAQQMRSLSTLSGSTSLRDRADELDRLASAMEQAAAQTPTTSPVVVVPDAPPQDETSPTSATSLDVAAGNQAGTYEEEVVSSSRFAQSPLDAASATTIITRQDIRLTGLTSIPELLRRAAGVHVMSMTPSDANVAIRGFNRPIAPRVVFLINGRSAYTDTLGGNFYAIQSIDVEEIERIEIVRGPASALYGANAFSGIINVITRAPGDGPAAEISLGGGNGAALRGHLATTGRRGALGYRLSAGYQQQNRWTRPYATGERTDLSVPAGYSPDLALRETHVRSDFNYRVNENVRLTFEGGYSYADQFNLWAVAGFTDTLVRGPTSYAMSSLQSQWGSIRGFWNRYDYDIVQSDQHLPSMHMTGNTVDVEAVFAHELNLGIPHNVHLGVGYRWKSIDWTILDRYHTQNHYSLFFEDTMRVSEAVRITAGFRMDRHPLIDKLIWSPRLAVVLRPTDGQSIRFSGTSSFRTMSFAESYVQFAVPTPAASAVAGAGVGSVQGTRAFGQPALNPERIITAEVGYLNQESERFDFEISAYYNRVWNFMEIDTGSALYTIGDYANPALSPYTGFNAQSNQFLGAVSLLQNDHERYNVFGSEIGARVYPVDGLDVYANYSFNYAYVANPLPGESTLENRQPRHMFNTGLQYRSPIGLDVAGDLHVYARTWSPETVLTASGIQQQLLETNALYLINARVGWRLLGDRIELGLAVQNLTNNRVRQNPNAQMMSARVMASLTARF